MTFEECVKTFEDFMTSRAPYILNDKIKNKFETVFSSILEDIKKMKETEGDNSELEINDLDGKLFCINYLTAIFVEQSIDDEILDYIRSVASIIISWNENLAKNEDLLIRSSSLLRYCEGLMTMRETISLLREILGKFREVKDWLPPAFQVSEKYLECLDRQITDEACCKD